jgi:very-short-patch-repair endonuclease
MKYMRNDPVLIERRRDLRRNQTEAEKVFWKHVRNRQFHGLRFVRQYSVGPYILDFYCPALKLAIELDGGQHNEEVNQEYDKARSMYLKAQGIDEMRFWNHEMLRHEQDVLEKLTERVTPSNSTSP